MSAHTARPTSKDFSALIERSNASPAVDAGDAAIADRRWMLEILTATAPIDTTADVTQLCRAAEALLGYMRTGIVPVARPPLDHSSLDSSSLN